MPAAPERQIPGRGDRQPLRHVDIAHRALDAAIVWVASSVQVGQVLGRGEGDQSRHAVRQPLLEFRLQRMIDAVAVGGIGPADTGELRIGPQKLLARDRAASQRPGSQHAEKRIVHLLLQRRAQREVIRMDLVEILGGRDEANPREPT